MVAGDRQETAPRNAIETLIALGDPRWVQPVCEAWMAGHPARIYDHRITRSEPVRVAVLEAQAEFTAATATNPAATRVVNGLASVLRNWEGSLAYVERQRETALRAQASSRPALLQKLTDRMECVLAARSLWYLGEPNDVLLPVLVDAIEQGGQIALDAIALIVDMVARDSLPDLRRIAEADTRTPGGVWKDELVQHDLHEAITILTQAA